MSRATLGLVFGYEVQASNLEDIDESLDVSEGELEEVIVKQEEEEESERGKARWQNQSRKSAYLRVFEDVVNDISSHEQELLSDEEAEVLRSFTNLSYAAMCIVTRLLQRNPDNWHSVSTMEKYKKDTGETGLLEGVNELCTKSVQDLLEVNIKTESDDTPATKQHDIIDLTLDLDDEEDVKPLLNAKAGPSRLPQTEPSNPEPEPYYFCLDESHMTLEEALNRLSVNSLNELAKEFKCKPPKSKKDTLIVALLQHARGQTVLPAFTPDRKGKQKSRASANGLKQTTLNSFVTAWRNQESVLRQRALKKLGRCIRINPKFYELVCRLNIIFYRSTEQPAKPFLPSLLTIFKKRSYPPYTHNRSVIWKTREEYLEYEEALACQARMSDAEIMPASGRTTSIARATAEPIAGSRSATPAAPSRGVTAAVTTPRAGKTPSSASSAAHIKAEVIDVNLPIEVVEYEKGDLEVKESDNMAMKRSKAVLTIFERERVQGRWEACLAAERAKSEEERRPELERFSSGYIYTRLMYKAAEAMGPLKRYEEEFALLQKLLSQKYWRRGKRGEWYQRRALIQETYLSKRGGKKTKDKVVLTEAWEGLMEALEDDDTHLVIRPDLVRRMIRLEQALEIPAPFQCKVARELRKPKEDTIVGKRIWVSVRLDERLKPVAGSSGTGTEKENRDEGNADLTNYFHKVHAAPDETNDIPDVNGEATAKPTPRWTGKSIWKGEANTEVIVEEFALQHYAKLGFNGFHAETKILTTIFALLFWDIIFADIPSAFETKFQAAPLDLAEDSFYYARKEMIDVRLAEIDNGHAKSILERHDKLYRDKKTLCVGVNWEKCKREDVFEIVECLSTETLNCICRLFCEDYAARASGVPDLVLWNYEHRKCQFVEVKGPGDKASATQKLWFDTLLGAETDVELLHVIDNTFRSVNKEHNKKVRAEERVKKKAEKQVEKRKGKRKRAVSDDEDEVEELREATTIVDGDDDDDYQPPDPDEPVAQSPVKRRLRSTTGDAEDENMDDPQQAVLSESQPRTHSPAWPRNTVEVVILSPPEKKRRVD
ncbi:coiled-coil domain-containing protein mtmr15 [Moniliophthora roreri]|nr:coiled-coil domain-containing protein mtmr15 [Moniliophthora roreri]